ncbi:MAG: repeat protein, partial [Bacteroidetes bacterium]|nr:repeat protein [Bacteroidota bacterium]
AIPLITNAAPFAYGEYSDHDSFWKQGYDAILLIEHAPPWNSTSQYNANPYYHTSSDTIETLNYSLLKRVTQTLFGTLVSLSTVPTAVADEPMPMAMRLEQNYPNPFNPVTRIRFTVGGDRDGSVGGHPRRATLTVHDILGREVAVLVDEEKPAGPYEVEFDGSGFPSGVYICRLEAGSAVAARRMVLLK